MSVFKILLICFLLYDGLTAQALNFNKEKIEITIDQNYSILNGEYYFEHIGFEKSSFPIYYPFVVNDSLNYPDSIVVYNANTLQKISFKKAGDGISFLLEAQPFSVTIINVVYRQKLIVNYFEYILTTTKYWKKPLEESAFFINAPLNFTKVHISYSNYQTKYFEHYKQFTFLKRNFLPDKNLVITWETNQ